MTEPEIMEVLRTLARDHLGADLGPELALDSMNATAFVVLVEDHFRICLPDDELANVRATSDFVGLVARRLPC
jgi:acyl carrier protein